MLKINDLHVHYGVIHALKGVSIEVNEGEIVTLIGSNGAGKSTLLKTISNLLPSTSGSIMYCGQDTKLVASKTLPAIGLVQVPEGRKIFSGMSVKENLLMGAY
jgi:branched-chain amino acid transport system ATP-binding protein